MKLLVSQEVYERRKARMYEMLAIGAPAILIWNEALLILRCHKPGFHTWWRRAVIYLLDLPLFPIEDWEEEVKK